MGYYSYPKEERVCHFSVSEAGSLKYRRSFACALKKSASGIADQKLVKPTPLTKVITKFAVSGFLGRGGNATFWALGRENQRFFRSHRMRENCAVKIFRSVCNGEP